MKKSAVDLLIEQLTKNTWYDEDNYPQANIGVIDFEQAKELEKKQLKQCYHFAQIEQQKEFSSIYVGMSFDKWYNEIYKNE